MHTTLPKPGDERIKSWFALLPVTVGLERRWLERVTVRQLYRAHHFSGHYSWRNIEFIDYTDETQSAAPRHKPPPTVMIHDTPFRPVE